MNIASLFLTSLLLQVHSMPTMNSPGSWVLSAVLMQPTRSSLLTRSPPSFALFSRKRSPGNATTPSILLPLSTKAKSISSTAPKMTMDRGSAATPRASAWQLAAMGSIQTRIKAGALSHQRWRT